MTTTASRPRIDPREVLGHDLCLLPAQPLLAAAQFTSTDPTKPTIQPIQISRDDNALVIRATDGIAAFRCRIPAAMGGISETMGNDIQLASDALRKSEAKAATAHITTTQITLRDAKSNINAIRPAELLDVRFPAIDQLWPDRFHFDPGKPLTADVAYIERIIHAAKRLGATNISQSFNLACTPLCYKAEFNARIFDTTQALTAEFLLMPIQNQAVPEGELERLVRSFNAKPRSEREHLTARLDVKSGSYAVNFIGEHGPVFSAATFSQAKALMQYLSGNNHD